MENIGNFLAVADELGVAKSESFQTVDLYEAQNIPQVSIITWDISKSSTVESDIYIYIFFIWQVIACILALKRKVKNCVQVKN
jgi:hypothetical protein